MSRYIKFFSELSMADLPEVGCEFSRIIIIKELYRRIKTVKNCKFFVYFFGEKNEILIPNVNFSFHQFLNPVMNKHIVEEEVFLTNLLKVFPH